MDKGKIGAIVGALGGLAGVLLLRRYVIAGPGPRAVNGMGDLNDDGYVSLEDVDILESFVNHIHTPPTHAYKWLDIPEASPLPFWEFIRRADMNYDTSIDLSDVSALRDFLYDGIVLEPEFPSKPAINGMGDLNDDGYVDTVDFRIMGFCIFEFEASLISPLPADELFRRADMNADGVVDIFDLFLLRSFYYS